MPMLPDALAQKLRELYIRLMTESKLPTIEELNTYYSTFRSKFGPQRLRVDGEALLELMHRFGSQDALVYWLEFKNDDEFPNWFGSIAGGSSLKYGVYPSAKTGKWMTRDASNYPVEITVEEAVAIAHKHRNQLLRGVALLENLPPNAGVVAYHRLQREMDLQAPDVNRVGWGHKYFSLLFPDKLDNFHSTTYQRFHLVKLLQSDIPEEYETRYQVAWNFVSIARELDIHLNHFAVVLHQYNGRPYRYWTALISDSYGRLLWNSQQGEGYSALPWPELGNLSNLKDPSMKKSVARSKLLERIRQLELPISNKAAQGILDFVREIKVGDVVVAFDGPNRRVMGIGRVKGDYHFDITAAETPHHRLVDWLETEPWSFSSDEGFELGKEIHLFANQVQIERHILEDKSLLAIPPYPVDLPAVPAVSVSSSTIVSSTTPPYASLPPSSLTSEYHPVKVFVSYRSTDSSAVDAIVSRLATIKDELGRNRYQLWQDKYGIPAGKDWWEAIVDAIDDCEVFMFNISQEALKSDVCLAELRYARARNRPLIPVVLEGEYVYNQRTGKQDIIYWDKIPSVLQDLRSQFLFYERTNFYSLFELAISEFQREHFKWRSLPTSRPRDPRPGSEASSDGIRLYDEAYDYAGRLEFETARRLFQKLINRNDPHFAGVAFEWIELLGRYEELIALDERVSTRFRLPEIWKEYKKLFPKDFIEGIFDPKGFEKRFL